MCLRGESAAVRTLTDPAGSPGFPGEVLLISATFVALIFRSPSIYAWGNQHGKAWGNQHEMTGTGTAWVCGWRRSTLAVCRLAIRD